jgi:phosphoribosylformylglycinamidine (FGAM) synthase PurS component
MVNAENLDAAQKNIDNASKKLLANTIVEDYTVTIKEIN